MIRLFTMAAAGEAYLNFMGNEFGHPEWIDFPREGNDWSFHYCRRQWSLRDNGFLKYQWLGDFDHDMVMLTKRHKIFNQRMADLRLMKAPEQMVAFMRKNLLFAFNFSPSRSLTNVLVPVPNNADYEIKLCTDDVQYGGQGLIEHITYSTKVFDNQHFAKELPLAYFLFLS
jgi:1,4-alpha-glucan branching enzyme